MSSTLRLSSFIELCSAAAAADQVVGGGCAHQFTVTKKVKCKVQYTSVAY